MTDAYADMSTRMWAPNVKYFPQQPIKPDADKSYGSLYRPMGAYGGFRAYQISRNT